MVVPLPSVALHAVVAAVVVVAVVVVAAVVVVVVVLAEATEAEVVGVRGQAGTEEGRTKVGTALVDLTPEAGGEGEGVGEGEEEEGTKAGKEIDQSRSTAALADCNGWARVG